MNKDVVSVVQVYNKVASIGDFRVVLCELTDEKFYHLDTCFCPLDDRRALYYPEAFSAATQQVMAEHVELIPVTKDQVC
jgi:N-dimethylarginine dimethylaminohydrolase